MHPTALLILTLCAAAFADGDLRHFGVPNLAAGATIEASCASGQPGAKYGIDSANDDSLRTWWASSSFPAYPIRIKLTFDAPVTIDTLAFVQAHGPPIYSNWKTVRFGFPDGASLEKEFEDSSVPKIVRFDRRAVEWIAIDILAPHDESKHYITLREIMLFDDREQRVKIKMPPTLEWKNADVTPKGGRRHPCVYMTPEDVAAARRQVQTDARAQKWFATVRKSADQWLAKDDDWLASILPEKGACFAYGFTGCPICSARWGTWGGARCSFDNPGHVTCANGHVLPDADHPDPGTGYEGPDGRIHYFVGSYNAWVVETLQSKALSNLALAHTLTGEDKYARKAAHIMDLLADIYPSCDAGSWDYPSNPPSGRFCRPWYQVARVLIRYTDWYDQIFHSPALDESSVREGMTRRENIERNLLQNGATYCYDQSLKGRLHNGEADYIRGALAVGCCLQIPWYIDWAYDGPYGILSLVRNNVCRDGRYFETSVSYANHTRNLYLTFAEPLLNYRSDKYPHGVNLYDDKQFQRFYMLPEVAFNCAGKWPRFGDSGPDVARSFLPETPASSFDYRLAERLYARVSSPEDKAEFAAILDYLTDGDVAKARSIRAEMPWMLFHAGPAPSPSAATGLAPSAPSVTDFFGQKGFVMLRSGRGRDAQAALIRFGPTLNHGHHDDLNLNYYALGYEVTYDLGYGLGSTHTQQGWSRQTASHNLVLVDETTQGSSGSGTGGSLHLLADLPGLQLTEVSSESCYVEQGVTTYRRLLALVGEGPEQYLVDIFRVVGGNQHDYILHALSDDAEFDGVDLSEPQEGSLAGPEFKWGAMQLNDGDMEGYPNKPYWRPPPGNGLGFLMNPQRAVTDDTWRVTWALPGGDAFLRLTMLGDPATEVISAWAPGIYPSRPRARYAIARRTAAEAPLAGAFIGILEPYSARVEGRTIDAVKIAQTAMPSAGETKFIDGLGVLLYKAAAEGDEMTWTFEVEEAGEFLIALRHYESPLYGHARLLIDGREIGEPIQGTAADSRPAKPARLGALPLDAGPHQAALRLVDDDGAGHYWFGIRALSLIPADQAEASEPKPTIESVLPMVCDDQSGPVAPAGVLVIQTDTADAILSAPDARRDRIFRGSDRELRLQGCFAHVRFRDGEPRQIHLVAAKSLSVGDMTLTCAEAEHAGRLRAVDELRAVVETDRVLPDDGRLDGALILFSNPRYSRSTAHRITRIEAVEGGSRIHLRSPSLILGTGILDGDPIDDRRFASLLAHEYARSNSKTGTQFFSGKRLSGEGFATSIVRTDFAQPMKYTVDGTGGMAAGARFVICDVQSGDDFVIPTTAHLDIDADGTLTGHATTEVVVSVGDERPAAVRLRRP